MPATDALAPLVSAVPIGAVQPAASLGSDGESFSNALRQARQETSGSSARSGRSTPPGDRSERGGSRISTADRTDAETGPTAEGRPVEHADEEADAAPRAKRAAKADAPVTDDPGTAPQRLPDATWHAAAPDGTGSAAMDLGARGWAGSEDARSGSELAVDDTGPRAAPDMGRDAGTVATRTRSPVGQADAGEADAGRFALVAGAVHGKDAGLEPSQATRAAGPDDGGLAAVAPTPLAQTPASPGATVTPAMPEREVRAPLHSPAFGPALGAQLTLLVKEGVSEARLHLNPAEMGPIAVQIRLDGTQARVEMVADHAMTRQVLEQSMPSLASALRDSGLTLAGGGVFEQSARQAGDDGSDRHAGGRKAGHGVQDDGAGQVPADALAGTGRTPRGVVDLYA